MSTESYRFVQIRGKNPRWTNMSMQAVRQLKRIESGIFAEKNSGICPESPINFLGALIVQHHQNRSLWLRMSTSPAIEILKNIPLFTYQGFEGYRSTETVASQVLYKHGCGKMTGVIISGPFSGLILGTMTDRSAVDGLYISRFWNDSVPSHMYHLPQFRNSPLLGFSEKLIKRNYRWYSDFVVKNPGTLSSELFFRLCEMNNIPVDPMGFNFTFPTYEDLPYPVTLTVPV